MLMPNRFAPLFQTESSAHPSGFDQSTVPSNLLDLDDGADAHTLDPACYSQEVTGWITEADGALFAQGSRHTNQFAKEDAYRALAMHDTVRNIFGFDSHLGEVAIADVRSQPTNADGGDATDRTGHVPDMTAVIRSLTIVSQKK